MTTRGCPAGTWTAPAASSRRLLRDPSFTSEPQRRGDPHLLGADGDAHRIVRRALEAALSDASVGLAARLGATATRCARHISGRADLVAELALPLTASMLAQLLRIEAAEARQLTPWACQAALLGAGAACATPTALAEVERLAEALRRLVDDRRQRRDDDIASGLWKRGFDADVVASVVRIVVIGAVETTSRWIGAALRALLSDDAASSALRAQPARIAGFVERVAAVDPALRFVFRAVAADASTATTCGRELPAGTLVKVPLTAARGGHLAFGAGHHRCVGAGLARAAVRAAVAAAVPHASRWRLARPSASLDAHDHGAQLGGCRVLLIDAS
jgi:cytochrome P450